MAKYKCEICGYIYDEKLGDEKYNIAPGTKVEDIPGGECPICKGILPTFWVKIED